MYGANRHWKIGESLATIGAVWLAAMIAGILAGLFPWRPGAPAASLLLYTVLLAIYARWTQAGRRSAGAYFLAGFLLPVACLALLIMLPLPAPNSFLFHCWELIFAGVNVGYQFQGGPDTPLEAYVPLTYLNILLPVAVVVGARSVVRYHRPD